MQTLRLVEFNECHREKWNSFAYKYGSVFHTIEMSDVLIKTFSYDRIYYSLENNSGDIMALLPLLSSRDLALKRAAVSLPFINYLNICCTDAFDISLLETYLKQILSKHNMDYIQLRILNNTNHSGNYCSLENSYTFKLPTNLENDQIMALSSSDNRNHTRKVYKKKMFTVSFDKNNLLAFYKVYQRRMHQLGSPSPSVGFFQNFIQLLSDEVTLLTVIDNKSNQVVGGMLLVRDTKNKQLYYLYGACLPQYNKHYINNFMYWEAVQFAKTIGMLYIDFGRSPRESGTYRYKKQWGATPISLCYFYYSDGEKINTPNKESMKFYINIWQKMPLVVANFIGRHLIKYVLP